jgi:hypothetical protein
MNESTCLLQNLGLIGGRRPEEALSRQLFVSRAALAVRRFGPPIQLGCGPFGLVNKMLQGSKERSHNYFSLRKDSVDYLGMYLPTN